MLTPVTTETNMCFFDSESVFQFLKIVINLERLYSKNNQVGKLQCLIDYRLIPLPFFLRDIELFSYFVCVIMISAGIENHY